VETGDVLVSILDERDSYGAYALRIAGVERLPLTQILSHGLDTEDDNETGEEAKAEDEAAPAAKDEATAEPKAGKKSFLDQFTTDLTALAR
jgi:ATP-dependent Clp protease ATP-binding subunit ClpA